MRKVFCLFLFFALVIGISTDNANAAGSVKDWTWLVYMDGDNNLEPEVLTDFIEMASVGSRANLNIVVQMDRAPGYSTSYGNWTETRRFLIQKGNTPSSTPVESLGEKNMGDKNTLKDFIVWGVTNYPAQRYVLVLWNHGGGWRNKVRGSHKVKAICWDETSNDACLYMRDVRSAIQSAQSSTGKKMNIVGFDACLMGMIEVANDLQGIADYMIGSEETEPGAGWPYDNILSRLVAKPSMASSGLAKAIVKEYNISYQGSDASTTQAAVDLSKIPAVNSALRNFVSNANQWSILKTARSYTRTYSEGDGYPHADLVHFMKNISAKGATDPKVLSAADAVVAAVQSAVILNKYGSRRTNSNGLAIYFPKTQTQFNQAYGSEYAQSSNNAATNWGTFIAKFLNPPADNPTTGDNTGSGGVTASLNGSGTAKVSRRTPMTSGKRVLSTTFTFKAGKALTGGAIRLSIPSGWTAPTTTAGANGEVLVKFATRQAGSMRISGNYIYVYLDTLAKGKTVKIYYKKFYPPASTGAHAFKVESRGPGGTYKAIATSPVLTVQ